MKEVKNHYKILDVSRHATVAEIKTAYRKAASKHHPDRGGNEEMFKLVSESYRVLSDPIERAKYNLKYDRQNFKPVDWSTQPQQPAPDRGNFSSFFRNMKRNYESSKVTSDKDIKFNLGINLEQIKRGVVKEIYYHREVACDACDGLGGKNPASCPQCFGTGSVRYYTSGGQKVTKNCTSCLGRGIVYDSLCYSCNGKKTMKVEESVSVSISGQQKKSKKV